MDITGVLGILAGLAVGAAVLLASYSLWRGGHRKEQDYLLAALLLAIALRIGKSIWYFILYGAAPLGVGLGFLGLASIGPLLLLYMRSMKHPQPPIKLWTWSHFVLPVTGMLLIWLVIPSFATVLYKIATAVMLLYLVGSWLIFRQLSVTAKENRRWLQAVLVSLSGIWMIFVFQHITDSMLQYAIGAGLAILPLHYLLFRALQENGRLHRSAIDNDLAEEQLQKVRSALELEHIYRTKGLTLNQFAASIEMPSYLVTRAVQKLYDRSFPETINHFRIKEVQQHLLDPENSQYKIESLAFDVGFSSASTFYSAFKKETQLSPKQFKTQQGQVS